MSVNVLLVLALMFVAASQANNQYPLFLQCDPEWGNNQMGVPGAQIHRSRPKQRKDIFHRAFIVSLNLKILVRNSGDGERSTICGEGCAMSSLAMALNGLQITLPGQVEINPVS
jgi:hypothetical protein